MSVIINEKAQKVIRCKKKIKHFLKKIAQYIGITSYFVLSFLHKNVKKKDMSYIKIEKDKLVNLEYTLGKEYLRTNRAGAYASSTLCNCNTRKYHGLLVVPLKDGQKHVLLSNVSETVVQHDKAFRLGINKFPGGVFEPHGHRYLREFGSNPIPSTTYRVGGVVLKKEILLTMNEHTMLIRYTLLEANSPTKLRLQPQLAFRNIHTLNRANMDANFKIGESKNGVKVKMYQEYPFLHMQCSVQSKYVAAPDWLYNIEYQEEQRRGYDYQEDLFIPGYFEVDIKKDQSVIFAAGLDEAATAGLLKKFNSEVEKRIPRDSFENSLLNAASQFFIKKDTELYPEAGFHWYGFEFREALISLAGLTLPQGEVAVFEESMQTILKRFYKAKQTIAADLPLHLIRTIQQYADYVKNPQTVWEKYGKDIVKIVKSISEGFYAMQLHDNGLLWIPENEPTQTWMNEIIDGHAVTPRTGYVVEINALWYNAVMFIDALATLNGDKKTQKFLDGFKNKIAESFCNVFINDRGRHLSDTINSQGVITDTRSNQIYAIALPYSPLDDSKRLLVLESIEDHLLTERGLRTLSPRNHKYERLECDTDYNRSRTKHQGSVIPWLLGLYTEAKLNIHGHTGLYSLVKRYTAFEEVMNQRGLGTISEYYSGNPPYDAHGAISYAPSIAEIRRMKMLIDDFAKNSPK